jgi:hypothetical protein
VKNFDRIAKIFPEIKNLPSDLGYYLKQGLQLMVSNFSILFSSIAKILIGIFVVLRYEKSSRSCFVEALTPHHGGVVFPPSHRFTISCISILSQLNTASRLFPNY